MVTSDSLTEPLNILMDFQDDEEESDKSESSSEEDTTIESNEAGLGLKNATNHRKVSGGDIMEWEKEVENMMESVKKIHVALSKGSKIEEVFKFPAEELATPKQTNNEEDLRSSLEEIEKMDAILRMKVTEEKKVKLSRIQAEEESRDILSQLSFGEMSNGLKVNLEEFMRLLNETDNSDEGVDQKDCETEEERTREKKDLQKTSGLKFVERNIQLAKCGRGTLSLTDEEKSRIENLLVDNEGTKDPKPGKEFEAKEEIYGIDDETKSILGQINEQLEVLAQQKILKEVESKLSLLEKETTEGEESGNDGRKKKSFRLKEIDKLLNSINSVSSEEIAPMTEEQIGSLIEELKKPLEEDCKPPREVIADLVSTAKSLMPKFKYRFDGY